MKKLIPENIKFTVSVGKREPRGLEQMRCTAGQMQFQGQ